MAWQTPKTDWKAGAVPSSADFNRIEGNILEVYNTANTALSLAQTSNVAAYFTTQNMNIYVDATNGNDSNAGTANAPLKTIQAALNKIPKVVNHTVTIYLTGTFNEKVTLSFTGTGILSIYGGTVKRINANSCSCNLSLISVTVQSDDNTCILLENCSNVQIMSCTINGQYLTDSVWKTGVYLVNTSLFTNSVTFNNFSAAGGTKGAINARDRSHVYIQSATFNNVDTAIVSSASIVQANGNSVTFNSVTNRTLLVVGGQIWGIS